MKDFENRKTTRFTERTLEAFSSTLMNLLTKTKFEDITIGRLCDETNYPRSTFYNYFEDIYDLLKYCWQRIYGEIDLDGFLDIPQEVRTVTLFERVYSYMDANRDWIDKAAAHNGPDGMMMQSLLQFVRLSMQQFFTPDLISSSKGILPEMLAEHYSNTVQMVLDWCFLREQKISKKDALHALKFLLGSVEINLR